MSMKIITGLIETSPLPQPPSPTTAPPPDADQTLTHVDTTKWPKCKEG